MYEPELNNLVGDAEELPNHVRKAFTELKESVELRTVLPWGEHCTECNWPSCYTSCKLYTPRADGGCRLFVDGMVRIDLEDAPSGYLLKMRFKQWGKLWTVGNVRMKSLPEARQRERRELLVGAAARNIPAPRPFKARVLQKVSYLRRREAEMAQPSERLPDHFVVECYNPGHKTIKLTVTIRNRHPHQTNHPYLGLIELTPGYSRSRLPYAEIARHIEPSIPFEVEMVPNDTDDTLLYFGLMEFVCEKKAALKTTPKAKKWKCIVWDLDNTLWDGTLIEDGAERLKLRQAVVDVIKETDKRGILHSVASKNNPADALAVLKQYGLEEYFLHPQISWNPKSQAVARIAQQLNIGLDSIAFVDDQPFEREEVQSSLPQVHTVDAREAAGIPGRSECDVPVTEEGSRRRQLYRDQEARSVQLKAHNGDYLAFLKDCQIRLDIERLSPANLERVFELAQRTNQMNFSGNRYPKDELEAVLHAASRATYVMRCEDRFGSYGIVGFGVVDSSEPRLLDLMFSCRIQGKRVEHTVISHLLRKYANVGTDGFFVNYRWTEKNAASGKVFDDLGFECVQTTENCRSLLFRKGRAVPDEGIITIRDGTHT